jgi:hypothetical protein
VEDLIGMTRDDLNDAKELLGLKFNGNEVSITE